MKRVMDQRTGGEFIVRNLLMPALWDAYDDTVAAAEDADLLVAHPMSLATNSSLKCEPSPGYRRSWPRWASSCPRPACPRLLPRPSKAPFPRPDPAQTAFPPAKVDHPIVERAIPPHAVRTRIAARPRTTPRRDALPPVRRGLFLETDRAEQPDWPATRLSPASRTTTMTEIPAWTRSRPDSWRTVRHRSSSPWGPRRSWTPVSSTRTAPLPPPARQAGRAARRSRTREPTDFLT